MESIAVRRVRPGTDAEMANVPLSFAINPYEHVRDLLDGTVRAEGIDFTSICLVI